MSTTKTNSASKKYLCFLILTESHATSRHFVYQYIRCWWFMNLGWQYSTKERSTSSPKDNHKLE